MSIGPKIWFITGISRGFGRSLAEALLARGAPVIGTTRNGSVDVLRGKGRLDVLALDVTDPQAVKATVAAAFQLHGRIDVIVNNAGYGLLSSIEEATDDEIEHVFAVNFHGTRRVIQAALPRLRAQRSGHVVNITSMAAVAPNPGSGYYAAAKMAVEGISLCLAREVAPLGIGLLVIMAVAAVGWSVFLALVIGRRVFPQHWFEHSIAEFGESQGMLATGFIMVDMVDPSRLTDVARGYSYRQLITRPIVGGGFMTALAVPLIDLLGLSAFTIATAVITVVLTGWGIKRAGHGRELSQSSVE